MNAPRYHRVLRDHFETTEPELWAWFTESANPSTESVEEAELELLRTAYRIDGTMHDVLTGYATLLAGRLELTGAVTLYQELDTQERNARVLMLGTDIHVVFGGDLLDLLTLSEQYAVLAHELAHVALWRRDDKAYWVLDHLVHRIAADPEASEAVGETARRLRLHTEVFADAIAHDLIDDRNATISAIVKLHSGLRTVDPEAYLRQARQILEADPASSQGWTHPELHVRVACLAGRESADPDTIIANLIEGPDDLDRLDLLGQLRLEELTGRVLAAGQAVAQTHVDQLGAGAGASADIDADVDFGAIGTHIDTFPAAVRNAATTDPEVAKGRLADGALAEAEPSVRHLCGALLVDVALAADGRATDLPTMAPLAREAHRLGVATEFDKILGRATGRAVKDIRRLRPKSQTANGAAR